MSNIEDDEYFVIKVVRERLAKLLINGTQGNLGTLKVGGLELHGELMWTDFEARSSVQLFVNDCLSVFTHAHKCFGLSRN